ncbi:hypothetical protein MKW94_011796, partial [Papaver nudicaule]|nr:hypothetical protein [Papaver nudicaule]
VCCLSKTFYLQNILVNVATLATEELTASEYLQFNELSMAGPMTTSFLSWTLNHSMLRFLAPLFQNLS